MTQHWTAAWRCVVSASLARIGKKVFVFFQRSRVLVRYQGLKCDKIKNEYAQRRRLRRNKFTSKSETFPIERLYQTPKKFKLAFQKYKLSNSIFKMQLQNCGFPNFNLPSPISGQVLRHNNACVRDVLTAPSNMYLNVGLKLFHSYF